MIMRTAQNKLALDDAAEAEAKGWLIPTAGAIKGSFKHGAEWQKEQDKELIDALKQIAAWPGNLPDEQYTSKTGANDAALRGSMVVAMRTFANNALNKLNL
jgi:hypothetical protein